jgi:hypothetical protein
MEDVYRMQREQNARDLERRLTPKERERLDADRARVGEDEIEVKYVPNRAQRRAAERARRASVRRGQRAADRRIAELEKDMSPEQIARARALAAKQLGGRR